MSSKNVISNEVSVDEQAYQQPAAGAVDAEGFAEVDDTPEFRPSVEQEIQAKVDANHPDARLEAGPDHMFGKTLVQEERIQGREAEVERISSKATFGMQKGREARTRELVVEQGRERRKEFFERAGSVDPRVDPRRPDARETLSEETLGAVNTEAMRLDDRLNGWSRAAIARELGERISQSSDLMSAVLGTVDTLETAEGQVVPIGRLEDVDRGEVCVTGQVEELWVPSHPSIAQVGLIGDETGRTRLTIWERSDAPLIKKGEIISVYGAARNWYQGRISLAVTGWSQIRFHDRDPWWV